VYAILFNSHNYFLDPGTLRIANDLIQQETPIDWLKLWPGPDNPRLYLTAAVSKTSALQKLQQTSLLDARVDITSFFYPEALLKALKQLTAR